MFSNYVFIFVLIAVWAVAFALPVSRVKNNRRRLLQIIRISAIWWVLGMTYHLLGFLLPNFLVPGIIDKLLSFTVALPCRLGIGVENMLVNILNLGRFDLAWAMVWGFPFAFLCSAICLAIQYSAKKPTPSLRRSYRG